MQLKDNQIYDDDSNLNNTNNSVEYIYTTQSTTVTRESTTEALNKSVR